jgi:hypothetical protein
MEMNFTPKTNKKDSLKYVCEICNYKCSKEVKFNMHLLTPMHIAGVNGNSMEIPNTPINIDKNSSNKIIICEKCNFNCIKESDFKRHLKSIKHLKNTNNGDTNNEIIENLTCSQCNKQYKTNSGIWKHRKYCLINKTTEENDNSMINDSSNNEMNALTSLVLEIVKSNLEVIKSNTELQKQNQEYQKQNQELQKHVLDVCQNIQPVASVNTINSHNKTFNLQVFLNEQCKDAMNLSDFVKSFKLQLSDLELVGDEGFINGMTKVIMAKLDLMDANTRPFHCTDLKRETIYVKEDDVWVREGPDNAKLAAAIKAIGHQNFFILKEYKALHPDCESTYSEFNDHYMNLIMKSAGCQKEDIAKVIKKLVKEIVIIKQ